MTMTAPRPGTPLPVPPPVEPLASLTHAARRACSRIAPLWPLDHFVAVNPFLGMTDMPFQKAMRMMQQASGEVPEIPTALDPLGACPGNTLSRQNMASNMAETLKIARPSANFTVKASYLDRLLDAPMPHQRRGAIPLTLAGFTDDLENSSYNAMIVDQISGFLAARFDQGVAPCRMPWRQEGLYAAWLHMATMDLGVCPSNAGFTA